MFPPLVLIGSCPPGQRSAPEVTHFSSSSGGLKPISLMAIKTGPVKFS